MLLQSPRCGNNNYNNSRPSCSSAATAAGHHGLCHDSGKRFQLRNIINSPFDGIRRSETLPQDVGINWIRICWEWSWRGSSVFKEREREGDLTQKVLITIHREDFPPVLQSPRFNLTSCPGLVGGWWKLMTIRETGGGCQLSPPKIQFIYKNN